MLKETPLRGKVIVPGDKSISHRSIMFSALAMGRSEIEGFLNGADCISTIRCFRQMGIEIEHNAQKVYVSGKGLYGLLAPKDILDCGNSGTTLRLLSGILSGQGFSSTLTGDASIQTRPMGRVILPLRNMGANIESLAANNCAPLQIHPSRLNGISYSSPVASAQVKSAILLAGLYAEGETSITEPVLSRNHTEIMLQSFGANVLSSGTTASIKPVEQLFSAHISIPGDISSAAYFLAAAMMRKDSDILLHNVGINPTRDGILRIMKKMGANIEIIPILNTNSKETSADIRIRYAELHATTVEGEIIPALIDEIPVIAVLACIAEGTTVIRDAAELKVKESNRIRAMVTELRKLGADITETEDGMIIKGGKTLHSAEIESYGDHRIAMSFSILGLYPGLSLNISDKSCIQISYPNFYKDLQSLL